VIQLGVKIRPMRFLQFFAKFFLSFLPKRQGFADELLSLGSDAQRSAPVMTSTLSAPNGSIITRAELDSHSIFSASSLRARTLGCK
jgi:hypothetical protein